MRTVVCLAEAITSSRYKLIYVTPIQQMYGDSYLKILLSLHARGGTSRYEQRVLSTGAGTLPIEGPTYTEPAPEDPDLTERFHFPSA